MLQAAGRVSIAALVMHFALCRAASAIEPLERAVVEIEAGRTTTPLVRPAESGGEFDVTFLAKRIGRRVPRIVSDLTGWGEHVDGTFDFRVGLMTRVGRTEWYSLTARVAPRARIEYLISYGLRDYRTDPHNPRRSARTAFGAPASSEFVTPGYVTPPEFASTPVTRTRALRTLTIRRSRSGQRCQVAVYSPPTEARTSEYPLAVFLERRGDTVSRVLDALIARNAIPPVFAVFVDASSCGLGAGGNSLLNFLNVELPRAVASRFPIHTRSSERAILAVSFNALDALEAALSPGSAFGKLGLLIPGRRITPERAQALVAQPHPRLRVAILAGIYDQANIATARFVREALRSTGDVVDYTEVPEGHSPVTRFYNLGSVLIRLFGRELDPEYCSAGAGTQVGISR